MHSDLLLPDFLLYPSDLVFCLSLPYFFFFCINLFFTLLLQCSCLLVWKLNMFLEKWGALAFVCASTNIYAHMYMCVCMWRPESTSCIILYPAWVSNCQSHLVAYVQRAWGVPCLCLPSSGTHHTWFFSYGLWNWTQILKNILLTKSIPSVLPLMFKNFIV